MNDNIVIVGKKERTRKIRQWSGGEIQCTLIYRPAFFPLIASRANLIIADKKLRA